MVVLYMSKVFICYSHADKEYFDLINNHLSVNKKDIDIWSDIRIEGGDNWRNEIHKALNSCNLAVLILSSKFFNSDFIQNLELKQLLENEFEKGTKLLPILLEDCDIEAFSWIETNQILPSRNEPLETLENNLLKTKLKEISQKVRKLLELVPDDSTTKDDVKSKNYPYEIAVNNFPISNDNFFGRKKYFDILDRAWNNEQVNILSFIAFGGIGKTSLIDNWLKMMKKDHYSGAKNIFMWSFYSQGSEEDRQITATEFLLEACKFFKIEDIPHGTYEQGRKLANVISKKRNLLVLDGLEPLQSSLENIGEIKDDGLQVLLKRLSYQNKGLVIITSRIKLACIDNQYEELEKLEDFEGAELLKSFKLSGSIKDLEQISKDFDGHALALKLLGSYIKVVFDKDITRINEIESLRDDQTKSSNQATKMLNSYKKYLEREGKIELDILKILGFFDRAISFEVIDEFKNKSLIKNINDNLVEVSEIKWKYALNNLKELYLINSVDKVLDAHPLVREYFSKYVEENYFESYIDGHYKLYKYFEKLPKKKFPETIEEMEPLFHAIYHGSKAKKYKEVYLKIYFDRINRNQINYLINNLTANDKVLQVLANFYKVKYSKCYDGVDKELERVIRSHVAYALYTQGKINQALNLYHLDASNYNPSSEHYDYLIRNVSNIFDSYCELCKFDDIDQYYKKFNPYASLCEDPELKAIFLASYAYSHFLRGNVDTAIEIFKSSEKVILENALSLEKILLFSGSNKMDIEKVIPKNIYSVMSFMYFELLFYNQDYVEIKKRIYNVLEHSINANWPLDIGLSYIILGKLELLTEVNKKDILDYFDNGISYLRKTKDMIFLTTGLIYRADMYISFGNLKEAKEDLEEVYDILIRSDLKKNFADWYIITIKLAIKEKDIDKAVKYFNFAKELSKELDKYFIFKEELKKLEPNFSKGI